MKKTLLALLLFIGLNNQGNAQSFSFENGTTVNATIQTSGLAKVYNKIKNTAAAGSGDSITVKWSVTSNDLPVTWTDANSEFGICDNIQCYGNGILTGTIQTTAKIPPQETSDFHMQINLDAAAPGTHTVKVNFREGFTNQDATFIVNKWPTGLTTITKSEDDIVMYPNPARDYVNVVFSANDNVRTISIHNMIGKLVNIYKVSANSAKLDVADLPAGVYFVRLTDAQGNIVGTRKFTHQ